ncbi:hypothetical protein LCGC14_1627980 [marine sediment metagenome]|uniref:Uncharacterized protein n=1 Tax=marine sediment metagenome TaxID=412755 RepID=A0A0F9IQJ5_9ZZZZ
MMAQSLSSKLIKLFIFSLLIVFVSKIAQAGCNCNYVLNLTDPFAVSAGSAGLASNGSILLAGDPFFSSPKIHQLFKEFDMSVSQTNSFYAVNDSSSPFVTMESICISGNQVWIGFDGDAKSDSAFGYEIAVYTYPDFGDQFIATYNGSCGGSTNIACSDNFVYNLCDNNTVFKRSLSDYSLVSSFDLPFSPTSTESGWSAADDDSLFAFVNGYDSADPRLIIFNSTDLLFDTNMSAMADDGGFYYPQSITFNGTDTCEFFLGSETGDTIQKIGCLPDCIAPPTGDWVIEKGLSCTLAEADIITGNLNISDGTLEIQASGALTVSGGYVYIYPGNQLSILSGGQING